MSKLKTQNSKLSVTPRSLFRPSNFAPNVPAFSQRTRSKDSLILWKMPRYIDRKLFSGLKGCEGLTKVLIAVMAFVLFSAVPLNLLQAQTNVMPLNSENINSSGFKLVVCDGPAELNYKFDSITGKYDKTKPINPNYVPCDFKGAMMQVQHLINIAIIVGILASVGLVTYAGILLIWGGKHVEEAKKIFPKVFWGFIIMLSAWFIVYQLLNWLTGSNVFSVLLGQP